MAKRKSAAGHGFGTAPVFLAAISTILGAVLFLRFGYAVAHAGLIGSLLIILIGHAITLPTALAVAEIATNLKVEGGGEYFMISRSFGTMIGGTIGISLYLSQAVSVAFYMIAFSEAATPAFPWIHDLTGIMPQKWMISIPATVALLVLMVTKGADLGVAALWGVVAILGVSLFMFFLGAPSAAALADPLPYATVAEPDQLFKVFAIIFPAFTGMTAGVGLSGDLKNPRRSIPLGTLAATIVGMIVYVLVIFKMAYSLTPDELAADQFSMSKIAVWGPIIPIGLAAATVSSAIGSILIAPRTLQALAADRIFPGERLNHLLARGRGAVNEPVNATLLTALIVFVFVAMGSVDMVAQVISMFFMVTYGTINLVSFLEHFAGNPSYRPTFHSRWYLSLLGALACFIMMFQMQPMYAFFAVIVMIMIYTSLKQSRADERDLSAMLRGVLFQLTRKLQVLIQKKQAEAAAEDWRPSFIAISSESFTRLAPFDLLRWISHHYGFGTFIHFIKGALDEKTNEEAKASLERLIRQSRASEAGIYVDTIISPSFRTAIAQIVQIPGISGMENNSVLFEFNEHEKRDIADIIDGCRFAAITGFNVCVLRSSERRFGYKKNIHVWLTPGDYRNANLMIILAYIIIGHPEWRGCEITLFATYDSNEMDKQMRRLNELIDKGRIPISQKNVRRLPLDTEKATFEAVVSEHSDDADLVITGFSIKKIEKDGGEFFKKFQTVEDILFVYAGQKIVISEAE